MEFDRLEVITKEWHGTYRAYGIGLVFSLILTWVAFYLVAENVLEGQNLFITLVILAILQASFQLLFFLHVGQEEKPRWETLVFAFMVMVVLIIGIGTLWIMFDLGERVMSYMKKEHVHD